MVVHTAAGSGVWSEGLSDYHHLSGVGVWFQRPRPMVDGRGCACIHAAVCRKLGAWLLGALFGRLDSRLCREPLRR